MSLSSAFSNATSGLTASARAVQVVSSNIANALTEGYAARQINLSAASLSGAGTGVRITGVSRQLDAALLGLTRDAGAQAQSGTTSARFWQRLEGAIGLPGSGLSQALSTFDAALIAATERPDLDSRLGAVTSAAGALAGQFDAVQTTLQSLRTEADATIARDVETLNAGLRRVDDLNEKIVKLRAAGHSTLGLEDDRQALLTTLSDIVPLREYARDDGRVTLFSAGGQLLLDIAPQEFGFTQTHAIGASMTLGSALSGLTIGTRPVTLGSGGPLAGGRLAASFAIRDDMAVAAQAEIDTLSADLIERFQNPATDPTLAPGQPGLFTDAGAALSGPVTPGLAGRLAVNDAVLPAAGGALWHLRDGLGAPIPGPVGAATGIRALLGALERPLASMIGGPQRSFAGGLAEATTRLSHQRQSAEDTATSTAAHLDELTQQTLAQGVDRDAELQRLLTLEQAYSANARVIETADAMLRRLLEI